MSAGKRWWLLAVPAAAVAAFFAPGVQWCLSAPRAGLRPARPPRGFKQSGEATFA
jgi:hypothetical protein